MSAYPITLKVTIDFSSGASFGTTLLLGDPEYGKLGFNVLGDAASEVYDITSSTIQIATKRGYNLLQDQFDTGTANLRVVDPYAYWNPQNVLSPFYGKQIPLRKIKITATYSGTEYDVFAGYTTSYNYTYPKDQDTGFVDISCEDGFRLFNMSNISTVTGAANGDYTGTRIGQILDQIGFPPSERIIATGDSQVQNDPATSRTALASIKNAELCELGAFYMDAAGNAVFLSRSQVEAKAGQTPTVFNNNGVTGINYFGISFANDDKLVVNGAVFTRIGGSTQSVADSSSVAIYFPHTYTQSNLVAFNDTQVLNMAKAYVATRKDTTLRIDNLVLSLTTPSYSNGIIAALGLDYFSPVSITNYQQDGTSVTKTLEIVGVSHEITPKDWKTTFTTSEPIIDAFILNSSTWGVLDTSMVTY